MLFIELNTEKLKELTYSQTQYVSVSHSDVRPITVEGDRSIQQKVGGTAVDCSTNTKITTEINNKDYSILSYQEELEIFKKQIDYDAIRLDMPYQKDQLDEIVNIAAEVLTTTKETIRVNREERPAPVIKAQFRKLNAEHIRFVFDSLDNSTTEVKNIRAMMIKH